MSAYIANKRFENDERVKNLDEERKEDSRDNGAIVERMVKSLGNYNAPISMATLATKSIAKSQALQKGLTPDQLKQIDDINSINKTTNTLSLEGSPYAKYLGELAGGLGIVQQVISSRQKAKEQREISDNLTKAVYHLQNGGKFNDVSGAVGAGTAKNLMGAAGTISAGSWLHDMATTGQISGLTSSSLTMANPGMMATGLFGGIGGLGQMTGSAGAGILNGLGSLTGFETLGKGAKALSTLDPTMATLLGTMSMIGIGVGANKFLNNMVKNSPLATEKRQSRWNLNHSNIRALDNPVAMSNYMQSNNILKQMSNQQILSPGEVQTISKLNEIAFYTSSIQDIYDSVANKGNNDRNSSTRAMNKIDKDLLDRDMSGRELQNLFKDGKLSTGMLGFLRTNEALGYVSSLFNLGMYLRSLSGKDTAPGQFKTREALQQGDPEGAKKRLAGNYGITLADVDLLHGDLKEKIASADTSYEGRLLASSVYGTMLLQLIATKITEQSGGAGKGGSKSLIGEFARLQEEQEAKFQENQNMFIDGTLKPIMKWMATVPGLSMAVPALHSLNFVGQTGFKTLKGLAGFVAKPIDSTKDAISGVKNIFGDMKDRVIDSMKIDDVKNEQSIRTNIGAKTLSLQDQANMYIARYLPQDMQKIQWLLGSTEKAKVQDRYTGEFVTPEELKKRYSGMADKIRKMTTEVKPEETYFDEMKNWGLKKIFGIKDEDIRVASHKNYSHVNSILKELKVKNIKPDEQSEDLEFRADPRQVGTQGTPLYSTLNFLTNQIRKFGINSDSEDKENQEKSYKDTINEYLPLLEDIKVNTSKYKTFSSSVENKFKGFGQDQLHKATSFNPLNLIKSKDLGVNNLSYNPRASTSMQDEVEKSQAKNIAEKLQNLYFDQLPYLEKIYKEVKRFNDPKKEDPKPDPDKDGLWDIISGIGSFVADGILDLFGLGSGKTKGKVGKFVKNGATKLSGVVSGGLMRMAAVLAKPGPLAIGAVVAGLLGAGIDFFFNDGKMLKGMWDSLKESSFGQTVSGMWDKASKWLDESYNFFANFAENIKNAFIEAWEGTKKNVTEGFNNAVDATKNFLGFGNEDKKKELETKILNLPNDIEKLKIIQKSDVDESTKKELQEKIIKTTEEKFEKTYNVSSTPQGIEQFYKEKFNTLNVNDQAKFFNDYNETLQQKKLTSQMGKSYEEWYNKLSNQMSESFKEKIQQIQPQKDSKESLEQQKLLQETLKSIQEQSVINTKAINEIVQTNKAVGSQTLQGIGEQISGLNSSQQSLANMLNITAKTVQKPNVIELDKHVIGILPILKG